MEKKNNEVKLRNEKKSEDVLSARAAKLTIQILYEKRIFDNCHNADEVLKDYLLIKINQRRRPGLEGLNDDAIRMSIHKK